MHGLTLLDQLFTLSINLEGFFSQISHITRACAKALPPVSAFKAVVQCLSFENYNVLMTDMTNYMKSLAAEFSITGLKKLVQQHKISIEVNSDYIFVVLICTTALYL